MIDTFVVLIFLHSVNVNMASEKLIRLGFLELTFACLFKHMKENNPWL